MSDWLRSEWLATGCAAVLFALTFLFGQRVHPLSVLTSDHRAIVSFGAGMAAAYVFVHVMPELHTGRVVLAEAQPPGLRHDGMTVYLVALIGFMAFYGLEHLRARVRASRRPHSARSAYRLHVGAFAAYVALVGYLLVRNLEDTPTSVALYTAAMAFHFLGVDHSLCEEHGARYEKNGRYVLAASALAGWAIGQAAALPRPGVALLVAFLSGAVIVNSSLMELPSGKDGRFVPFLVGGLLYGLILLPLG